MKNIIKNIIEHNKKNFLFLLDAPTGLGKTEASLDFMKEFLENKIDTDKKQIIFITNLKKNLPYERFIHKYSMYANAILNLKPNSDIVIENFIKIKELIPSTIKKSEEYKELDSDLKQLNLENDESKRFITSKIERISEPNFRKMIKKTLFQEQKDKEEVYKKNLWLKAIYPASNLSEFKIIFLSTDKFLSPIDPIWKKPYYFYEKTFIKNIILIIDEYDSSKKTFLNHIIDDGLLREIDLIQLFSQIYLSLKHKMLPNDFYKASKQTINNSIHKENAIHFIVDKNIEVFENVYNKYHLKYVFKAKDLTKKAFIFNDKHSQLVTNQYKKGNLYAHFDAESNSNIIIKSSNDNSESLPIILKDIRWALIHFINGIRIIANNYYEYQIDFHVDNKKDKVTKQESIYSVLDLFNLDKRYKEILFNKVLLGNLSEGFDLTNPYSFYKQGINFIEIEDGNDHDLQSKFHLFDFNTTPEKILLELANTSMVIGLSATAKIPTIVGNFDNEYLKNELKDHFIELKDHHYETIRRQFNDLQLNYIKQKMHIEIIDAYNQLEHNDIIDKITTECNLDISKWSTDPQIEKYYLEVCLKVAKAYFDFSNSSKSVAGICFLNGFFSEDSNYDVLILSDLLKQIQHNNQVDIEYFKLTSQNFDEELLKIHNKIINEGKGFVLTTYNTVGLGKNIQLQRNINGVKIEQDFDFIYLLEPTNIISDIYADSDNKYKDLSRVLFEQEYLKRSGSISKNKFIKNIENAFRMTLRHDKSYINKMNKDNSIHVSQIIIQAIGRITRSRTPNTQTTILLDNAVVKHMQAAENHLNYDFLNWYVRKILSLKIAQNVMDNKTFTDINRSASLRIEKLSYKLRTKSNAAREEWRRLKDYILKNPTTDFPLLEYKNLYIEMPERVDKYWYQYINSFAVKNLSLSDFTDYSEVSDESCELIKMVENNLIKEEFENEKIPTKFYRGKHIILPSVYQQTYLGALGEKILETIVYLYTGEKLQEVKNYKVYEYADFQIGNIYVDVKHWKNYRIDDKDYKNRIERKILEIKEVERFIFLNLFKRGDHTVNETIDEKIITIPYIFDDNGKLDDEMVNKFLNLIQM